MRPLVRHAALAACLWILLPAASPAQQQEGLSVRADLVDSNGRNVGEAIFTESSGVVSVAVRVEGLPPGRHGIHVHEAGLCDPPGFKSAGGHFNPMGKKHGLENPAGSHAGDLPNLVVDDMGKGRLEAALHDATLKADAPNSLLGPRGSAVVIHTGPDDEKTDPAGASGERIACGVISPPR
jgi:Cu-Zn family superoxide dismutase